MPAAIRRASVMHLAPALPITANFMTDRAVFMTDFWAICHAQASEKKGI
jgi:hypothetical protein